MSLAVLAWAALVANLAAADVYKKQFDPPRVYFTHANLNKNGALTAIEDQDNFLGIYLPGIDRSKTHYAATGFRYVVFLPEFVTILADLTNQVTVTTTRRNGRTYQRVEGTVDPEQIRTRCFRGFWGVDINLWYRVQNAQTGGSPQPIWIELYYQGRKCFISEATMRVHQALRSPPRIDPRDFRFWLHYGPHYRRGHWDELAEYLRKAGINALQLTLGSPSLDAMERLREMRKRGFYIISQRAGSYEGATRELEQLLSQGPEWFARADDGCMQHYLPVSDAAIWDFEPSPGRVVIDAWTLRNFRREAGIPAEESLDREVIESKYLRQWISFRQNQFAECVKHWDEFCGTINPGAETILTEGRVNVLDPLGQIDYAKYGSYVTLCDPMNFTQATGLANMQKWIDRTPGVRFTGCQNVAAGRHSKMFVSARSTMLQVIGAALIGLKGTSIYPGTAVSGEEFVLLNRAAHFLGRNQEFIWKGRLAPSIATLEMLPKEETVVELGDGRQIRDLYPQWAHDGIARVYARPESDDEYLVIVENLNAKEPCYARLTLAVESDGWRIIDDEHRTAFAIDGDTSIAAATLNAGVHLVCPPQDVRGFRVVRNSEAIASHSVVDLDQVANAYRQYAKRRPAEDGEDLIFHVNFQTGPNAVRSGGNGRAAVKGDLQYETTPEGQRAAIIREGVSIRYFSKGNVDLQRGKIYLRFKPLWHGADGKTHEFLRITPLRGLLYFGKLADGRLILNLFDERTKQHYPWYLVRSMDAGGWHHATATWDADVGRMSLFLDGEKVATVKSEPWRMGRLDDRVAKCRIVIPASAEMVIDEIKIWSRP